MTDLPKCRVCGMSPALRIRSRGMNWGSAEVRCSNGCPGIRAGFSFPPNGEAAARRLLQEKWKELVGGLNDAETKKKRVSALKSSSGSLSW